MRNLLPIFLTFFLGAAIFLMEGKAYGQSNNPPTQSQLEDRQQQWQQLNPGGGFLVNNGAAVVASDPANMPPQQGPSQNQAMELLDLAIQLFQQAKQNLNDPQDPQHLVIQGIIDQLQFQKNNQ